jgi:hypothetical protein
MLELDVTDLIEFFEVTPEPQSQDEEEFFAAPLFVKTAGGIRMTFSISANFDDLFLDLALEGHTDCFLQYTIKGIEAVRIENDKGNRPWLLVRSRDDAQVAISLSPSISIRIAGN